MTDYDVAKAVHTHTVDEITNVTDFAQGVLTGSTDAATFRTAIGAGTGSGSSSWGAISGTLSSQTDLQAALTAKYTEPSGGIPKTDLASAVQTSLGKADTALQSVAAATTTVSGIVPLATTAQATAGTDTAHAVTPAGLAVAPVSAAQTTAINTATATAAVSVLWDATNQTWGTYSTDTTRVRLFLSQNDANATAPTAYNQNDMWWGAA